MNHSEDFLAERVLDLSFSIHRNLGPGLLESVYEKILFHELQRNAFHVQRQSHIPIVYRGMRIENAFTADLIVEQKLIIEIKSVEKTHPIHYKQLLTYLRLTDLRLGLLINFGEHLLKDGIKRIANGMKY
jgi:GxxExxY protein